MELPAGLRSRPAMPDDLHAVVDVLMACEQHDDGSVEIELSDVASAWRRPSVDLATMTTVVLDQGCIVAYAEVFSGRAEVGVHPDHRGRGIGTALAVFTWDVARRAGRTDVGQTVSDNATDAVELFTNLGYRPRWTAWILDIAVDGSVRPTLPDGYAVRDVVPHVDDREAFAVVDAAFGEWPDRDGLTFGDWRASTLAHDRFVAEASPVIVHEGDVIGVAINFDFEVEGWVEQLAVARDHRGRGLGRALLQESFLRHHARGRRTVALSTDSRTGALSLYEHVGMRVRRSYTRWSKQLT